MKGWKLGLAIVGGAAVTWWGLETLQANGVNVRGLVPVFIKDDGDEDDEG